MAILSHDESQIDYYGQIVKNMPGRVLASHGIVRRDGDAYHLEGSELTAQERGRVDPPLSRGSRGFQSQAWHRDLGASPSRTSGYSRSPPLRDAKASGI